MSDSASEAAPRASGWRKEGRACAAAFTFMTRVPVGNFVRHDLSDLAHSSSYFPLVGLYVGTVATLVFAGAQLLFTPLVAVVLSVMVAVYATGAFHEDALADSLDGFGGGWTKDQVLAIMKDSRVGSYALIGVVLVVALRIGAILGIHEQAVAAQWRPSRSHLFEHTWPVARALLAAHVFARWSSVWLIRSHAYVRADVATEKPAAGRPFVNAVTGANLTVATLLTLLITTPLLQWQMVPVVLGVLATTLLAGRYFRRRIGGITGDALGAANQLVEVSVYLVLVARPLQDTIR